MSSKQISVETSHSEDKLLSEFLSKAHQDSECILEKKIMYYILGKKRVSKAFIKTISLTGKLLSNRVSLGVEGQVPTKQGNHQDPLEALRKHLQHVCMYASACLYRNAKGQRKTKKLPVYLSLHFLIFTAFTGLFGSSCEELTAAISPLDRQW